MTTKYPGKYLGLSKKDVKTLEDFETWFLYEQTVHDQEDWYDPTAFLARGEMEGSPDYEEEEEITVSWLLRVKSPSEIYQFFDDIRIGIREDAVKAVQTDSSALWVRRLGRILRKLEEKED